MSLWMQELHQAGGVPGHARDKHCPAPVGTTKHQGKSPPGVSVKPSPCLLGWVWHGTFKACRTPCLDWELKENTPELPAPSLETCLCTALVPRFVSFCPACGVSECWRALPFLQIRNRNFHLFLAGPLMSCSRGQQLFGC